MTTFLTWMISLDDVADLFPRGGGVELGELREVDRVDQRVEDGRLDVIVLFGVTTLLLDGLVRARALPTAAGRCERQAQRQPAALPTG